MPATLKEIEEHGLENLLSTLRDFDEVFGERVIMSFNAVIRENRRDVRKKTLQDVASQLRQRGQDGLAQLFEQQARGI